VKRSALRLGGAECKEDGPHQETGDAVDPIVPVLQHVSRPLVSQPAKRIPRRRSIVDAIILR